MLLTSFVNFPWLDWLPRRSSGRPWHPSCLRKISPPLPSLQVCPNDPQPTRIPTSLGGGENTSCHFVNVWHNLNVSRAVTPHRLSPCETRRRKKNIYVSSRCTEELKKLSQISAVSLSKKKTSQSVLRQIRPGVFCLWRLGVAHEHFIVFKLF